MTSIWSRLRLLQEEQRKRYNAAYSGNCIGRFASSYLNTPQEKEARYELDLRRMRREDDKRKRDMENALYQALNMEQ